MLKKDELTASFALQQEMWESVDQLSLKHLGQFLAAEDLRVQAPLP
jgi:hypothetical protein